MTDTLELVAPCNFAVESIHSREIKNLGYEVTEVTDGRVTLLFSTSDTCIHKQGQGIPLP